MPAKAVQLGLSFTSVYAYAVGAHYSMALILQRAASQPLSEFTSEVDARIETLVFCASALCGECVTDGIEPV